MKFTSQAKTVLLHVYDKYPDVHCTYNTPLTLSLVVKITMLLYQSQTINSLNCKTETALTDRYD